MTSKWPNSMLNRLDVVELEERQPVAAHGARYPRKGTQLGLLFVKGGRGVGGAQAAKSF